MAYDEGLAERIELFFSDRPDVETRKMFGGLCFMVSGHMCCGIVRDSLMARVGLDNYQSCLSKTHAREMDFTGKPMKGMIYVSPEGVAEDDDLAFWVEECLTFVMTLPPKKPNTRIGI